MRLRGGDPKFRERTAGSEDRIGGGKREMRHPLDGFRAWRLSANVPVLVRRVSADHEKVVAGLDEAMSGSSRQKRRVARFDDKFASVRTAQHHTRAAGGKSERLVRGRMIVMKVVDAIPPPRRPSVAPEDGFEGGSGIAVAGDLD